MESENTHMYNAWTEIEYSPACKNPYLEFPFFVPGETSVYLCRKDGLREKLPLTFVVFKAKDSAPDDWEDDPMVGPMQILALGDDEEEIEPVDSWCLNMSPADFLSVKAEDDMTITFAIKWPFGDVALEKSEKDPDDDVFTLRKEDIPETGIRCTVSVRKLNKSYDLTIKLPYVGFALYDNNANLLTGDIEMAQTEIDDYKYSFVGNAQNDRFSISLDENKLNYLCVLRDDNMLAVRDMREKLSFVAELPAEGTLGELLMKAHTALVKNKDRRWRIVVKGDTVEHDATLECDPVALVRLAYQEYAAAREDEEGVLIQRLVNLEQRLSFQWFWLKEEDWNFENLSGLLTIPHDDQPEEMMESALKYNQFENFLHRLMAHSYVTKKPLQGDQLQARNNKRKIARCAKHILAHQNGTENIWKLTDEERQEILSLFGIFHREFTDTLEKLQE